MNNIDESNMEETSGLPANLLVLPLTTKPLFPGLFTPLYISGDRDITVINQVVSKGGLFAAIMERPHDENERDPVKRF